MPSINLKKLNLKDCNSVQYYNFVVRVVGKSKNKKNQKHFL